MNYKVLYRKYRPIDFNDVVGQDHIVEVLMNSIANSKTAHAYIFTGVRGTGKTSIAKIFAKAINCMDNKSGNACNKCVNCLNINSTSDVIEIDAASNNSVDDIREIVSNSRLVPSAMNYRIYIIDEVHMLSTGAFNALLKTLEEPVSHVKFILATTDVHKMPSTVLSRCQRFDFRKINTDIIEKHLKKICKKENIEYEDAAIREIAFLSDGALRDGLSILDQLSNINHKITLNDVQISFGSIPQDIVEEIMLSIEKKNIESFLSVTSQIKERNLNIGILINKLIQNYKEKIYNNINDKKINIDEYRLIILSLIDTASMLKSTYDSNMLFEMNMLSLMLQAPEPKEEQENSTIEVKAMIDNKKQNYEKDPLIDKIEEPLINIEDQDVEPKITKEIKKIRINNCFAEANKETKVKISKHWKKYIKLISEKDLPKYSLLEESVVEVSSEANAIISLPNKSFVEMSDKVLEEIEKNFSEQIGNKVKLCFLSKSEWEREKEKYIVNKNTRKYTIMAEPKLVKNGTKIKKQAIDIFGEESVEIKEEE